ncbi:uncharacterized protein LOC122643861 [Telopea speciosissima]|uniref:uncharacterized protein LOC122643861 n=1 Tax=Telopea speciosissima TaxID=54955 RepID=UPI001CC6751E|nr:uncharacterized protein LOC122643861 [Telopea speciosissima]
MEAKGREVMTQARRIHVIYFLSRMGRIEHPHLIRVHHFSRNGVHLRDVKRWLSDLRGKDMPDSFAWSYKRRYKTGYVWQDLVEDDLITPTSDNEYVLKGSEISSVPFGFTDACPCGEKKASIEKPGRNPENPQKKMEVSAKTSEIEIEIDEESSEAFESDTSTTTDESMKSNARKPEKEDTNSEKKNKRRTEKTQPPPLTNSATFSKSRSHSSGTSHVLRNLLTCGAVDTNDSAIMTINRINRTSESRSNEAGFCRTETMGGSQRIFGSAWNQQAPHQQNSRKSFTDVGVSVSVSVNTTSKSRNEPSNQKTVSAALKPIGEPNCSYAVALGFYRSVHEGRLGISREKSKPLDSPVPLNIVLPATNTSRYKIYTDGVWNSVSCLGGRGVIVRNHNGKFVVAKCKHGCSDSAMAMEAEAIRDALLLAHSIKVDSISIFSDCKALIAHLNNAHSSLDWASVMEVSDIRVLVGEFASVVFMYIPRMLNKEAHVLARGASLLSLSSMWWIYPPSFVVNPSLLKRRDVVACFE